MECLQPGPSTVAIVPLTGCSLRTHSLGLCTTGDSEKAQEIWSPPSPLVLNRVSAG